MRILTPFPLKQFLVSVKSVQIAARSSEEFIIPEFKGCFTLDDGSYCVACASHRLCHRVTANKTKHQVLWYIKLSTS